MGIFLTEHLGIHPSFFVVTCWKLQSEKCLLGTQKKCTSNAEKEAATEAATITATPEADNAIALIKAKEAIVAEYFKKSFNIDLYELQKLATDNLLEAIK